MHLVPEDSSTEPASPHVHASREDSVGFDDSPRDVAAGMETDMHTAIVQSVPVEIKGVSTSAQSALGLRIATVENHAIAPRVSAWGRVVADAANERAVTAPADGWIKHLYVQSAGIRIAAGAPLFEFYSPELEQRQRDYIDTINRRDQLLKSITDMSGQNGEVLGSLARERKRQRDTLLRLGIAPASIDNIETLRRPLETLTVVSTHAGLVTLVNARDGAAAGPAGVLYSVLDDSAVQLDVVLTPSQFSSLVSPVHAEFGRAGQSTSIPLLLNRAVFNAALQSYVVRTKLIQQLPMQPGSVLAVDVVGRMHNALAVPREALLEGPDGSFVITMTNSNSFKPRRITQGVVDRNWVEILEGLMQGDKVVTDGQFMLDAAATFQSTFASTAAL
jgi:Cu(I)/Ag(I) efflux system membrane fusion protein